MEKLKNSNEPLISIIIPVYCVEEYLEKCIESVCDSKYKNIEIILVDDGSTDLSGVICDKMAAVDNRIRVIHSDNYGQSHARNLGLDAASGEYIGFVDSDDWIYPDMYFEMINVALCEEADIVECNYNGRRYHLPDSMENNTRIIMSGIQAIERQLDYRICSRYPSTSVWSKLFHRAVLEKVRFPEGRIHEEYAFLCKVFCKAETYVYINKVLYEHVLRAGSTTANEFTIKYLDKLYVYQERNEYLKKINNEKLYSLSKEQEYDLLIYLAGETAKKYLFEAERQIRKHIIMQKEEIEKSSIATSKMRQYKLFFWNHHLYYAVRNIKNIIRHPREFIVRNIQREITIRNIFALKKKEKYYVIRCNQPNCGLFAIFMYVLDHIAYARDKGYIPVLCMQRYDCLYKEKYKINGTYNPWEYYFKPITEVTLKNLFKAGTVTWGKVEFLHYKGIYYYAQKNKNILPEKQRITELHEIVEQYIQFQPALQQELKEHYYKMKSKYQKVMGIHVRGTDMYVAGKQHNKPSSKFMDFQELQNIVNKNNIDGIFLCTDDSEVVKKFQKFFGDKIYVTDSVRQVNGRLEGIHFDKALGKGRKEHKYLLGKEVITDMYLLSKCNVLVCGPSNVAFAAMIFNNNSYEDIIYWI